MNEPSNPPPPFQPGSSPANPARQSSSSAPPTKKRWPWVLGGCGCLTVLIVAGLVAFGLFRVGSLNNVVKRSTTNFNPYNGKVADLLPDEFRADVLKFKLVGKRDATGEWKKNGATDANAFTYNQVAEGGGKVITVQIDGAVANFPSAEQALAKMKEGAQEKGATLTAKGNGQRFTTEDGKLACWSNGSVICFISSNIAKAVSNFEDAAPF